MIKLPIKLPRSRTPGLADDKVIVQGGCKSGMWS